MHKLFMRVLNFSHTIAVPAKQAFDWFINLDKNYIKWHPTTHKNFQWLSEKPVMKGSIFTFEEQIEDHRHKMIMTVSEFIENQRLSFLSVYIYARSKYLPHWLIAFIISILCIKMEMHRSFEEDKKNSTTIHTIHKFGSPKPVIGKIVDWVTEHFIFSSKNHLEHIGEEALNMKMDLETRINL